jgi:hypothetical protein
LTVTFDRQALNPSATLTVPVAIRCFLSVRLIDRVCLVTSVKLVALVAVPSGFVTVMGPVVAPAGTVAVICVAELTVNTAVVPLNFTAVVPAKFVPVMTTDLPTLPTVGENDVMVGIPVSTVKSAELTAELMVFVTVILPVVAPTGTVAVIWVAELTVTDDAVVVLNFTAVVPQKFVPVITTDDPTAPLTGANDVMVGAAAVATVKLAELVPSPSVSRTISAADPVDVAGTAAVNDVSVRFVSVAWLIPPGNVTAVASAPAVNPVPVMVTEVPTTPQAGVNPVTVSAAAAAGSAVASTPTTPSATTSAVDLVVGSLKEGSPFRAGGDT